MEATERLITDKDCALWDRLRDLIVHGSETDVLLALAEHREGGRE